MRLLCDEMLKRLGRWLRAAGHDVLMLPDGSDDRELLARARGEGRLLLTRDRRIAAQCDAGRELVLLDCNDLEDCVAALNQRLDIDWLHAPFSRCMNCNTPLLPATAAQCREVPAEALGQSGEVRYCPHCRQVFWDGSHVARMRERLAGWNANRQARHDQ